MRPNRSSLSRRSYLALAGAGAFGLAGCTSDGGESQGATSEPTPGHTETPTTSDPTPTETETPEVDPGVAAAEESLAELSFEGSWFDTHCHWRDAAFFDQQDYTLEDFTPVQRDQDVGATVMLIRADVIADRYDHIVQSLGQDDVNYLLFAGPGRQLQTVAQDRLDVLWGIGEIPFYEGTPQHGMSLSDSWIPSAIQTAADNDLVLQMHPTMDQEPELEPTMDDHPGLKMLLHGHELLGTTELLDLMDDYDDVYFTVDIGTVTAPLFFQSSGASDFVSRLDAQQSTFLNRRVPQVTELLRTAPDQVVWGTDLVADWHIEPTAYDRMLSFSETFVGELPATHRDAFKRENALALFGE